MTRQEAAIIIRKQLLIPQQLPGKVSRELEDALLSAVVLLDEGRAPDPDTGLVACGCGGPARCRRFFRSFYVECVRCNVSTGMRETKDGARDDWNRSRGYLAPYP